MDALKIFVILIGNRRSVSTLISHNYTCLSFVYRLTPFKNWMQLLLCCQLLDGRVLKEGKSTKESSECVIAQCSARGWKAWKARRGLKRRGSLRHTCATLTPHWAKNAPEPFKRKTVDFFFLKAKAKVVASDSQDLTILFGRFFFQKYLFVNREYLFIIFLVIIHPSIFLPTFNCSSNLSFHLAIFYQLARLWFAAII